MILFLGTIFTIALLSVCSIFTGSIMMYFDFISLSSLLVSLLYFHWISDDHALGNYIRASFTKNYEYSAMELDDISRSAKSSLIVSLGTSGFLSVTTIIAILHNIDNLEMLSANLSVGLSGLLYALGIGFFIFYPLKIWAERKKHNLSL